MRDSSTAIFNSQNSHKRNFQLKSNSPGTRTFTSHAVRISLVFLAVRLSTTANSFSNSHSLHKSLTALLYRTVSIWYSTTSIWYSTVLYRVELYCTVLSECYKALYYRSFLLRQFSSQTLIDLPHGVTVHYCFNMVQYYFNMVQYCTVPCWIVLYCVKAIRLFSVNLFSIRVSTTGFFHSNSYRFSTYKALH